MKAAPKPKPTSTLPIRKPASDPAEIVAAVTRPPTARRLAPVTSVVRLVKFRKSHCAPVASAHTPNTKMPPTAWFVVG